MILSTRTCTHTHSSGHLVRWFASSGRILGCSGPISSGHSFSQLLEWQDTWGCWIPSPSAGHSLNHNEAWPTLCAHYQQEFISAEKMWRKFCVVWNKIWFCLMPVHTCVVKCATNGGWHWGASSLKNVALVQCMHLVLNFTHMPDESHNRWLTSLLLCLCDVFQALISSLFIPSAGHLIQILNVGFNATSEQLQLTTGHSSPVSCWRLLDDVHSWWVRCVDNYN